jgi:hypothetical protein
MSFYQKRKECTVVFSNSQGSCGAHSAELVTVDSQGESDFIEAKVIKLCALHEPCELENTTVHSFLFW